MCSDAKAPTERSAPFVIRRARRDFQFFLSCSKEALFAKAEAARGGGEESACKKSKSSQSTDEEEAEGHKRGGGGGGEGAAIGRQHAVCK